MNQPPDSRGDVFAANLAYAEEMLQAADAWRERAARYQTLLASLWLAAAAAAGVVLSLDGPWRWVQVGAGAVIVVVIVRASYVMRAQVIAPLRHLARRDERCAAEMASLLRELVPFIVDEEDWDVYRKEEARLRLSRFPLEGGGA